jgi:hypothetical protein
MQHRNISDVHRQSLLKAIEEFKQASKDADLCESCGIPVQEQRQKIKDGEELAKHLLKVLFNVDIP